MADGALAALDDRPRPGKEPTITPEAKAWLVSLACDKGLSSTAIRMNCGRHGFWPAARARTGGGSPMSRPSGSGAPCASFSVKRKSSRTRCATIWNAATPSSSPRWRKFCVSTARSRSWKKAAAKAEKSKKPVAIVSYDEKPGIQAIATTAPILPPVPGRHASFARDHEYKRHGTFYLLAGIDLLTGKVHALVRERHRSREFIEFLKLPRCRLSGQHRDQADPRQSFRTHFEGNP